MKRFTLTLLLVITATVTVFAQDIKGSYKKAERYLNSGELAEAKKYIDAAAKDEKLASKSDTWFIKGKVYQAIALSEDESIKALSPNALDEALAAYDKVKEMEKDGSAMVKSLTETQGIDFATGQVKPSIIEDFRNVYFNKGVEFYNAEKYEEGMASFETSYKVMPQDTLAGLYAMTCAAIAENSEGVERNAKVLTEEMDYTDPKVYLTWARSVYAQAAKASRREPGEELSDEAKKLWDKVLQIAADGKKNNPDNGDMVKFMIDGYIRLGESDKAIASLEETVENNPEDKISYFSLGTLYDEKGDFQKAEAAFQKAIEIDPDFFDARFNYFVLYNNQIRETAAELNELIDSRGGYTDPEKGKALEEKITNQRKEAIEILSKCHELKPEDTIVIENLAFLYNAIGDEEKAEEMNSKL